MEWLWSFKCGACYVLVVDNNEVTATDALVYYYVHHDDDVDDNGTLALAILYMFSYSMLLVTCSVHILSILCCTSNVLCIAVEPVSLSFVSW